MQTEVSKIAHIFYLYLFLDPLFHGLSTRPVVVVVSTLTMMKMEAMTMNDVLSAMMTTKKLKKGYNNLCHADFPTLSG